jgi:hypothetical protein
LQQTLSNPDVFSLEGSYAVNLAGAEPPSAAGSETITGQVTLPGGATFTGVLDVDSNGAATQGGAFQTGVFTVDPNTGRGIATATPSSPVLANAGLIFYVVDSNRALVLENDSARILTGAILRQF